MIVIKAVQCIKQYQVFFYGSFSIQFIFLAKVKIFDHYKLQKFTIQDNVTQETKF